MPVGLLFGGDELISSARTAVGVDCFIKGAEEIVSVGLLGSRFVGEVSQGGERFGLILMIDVGFVREHSFGFEGIVDFLSSGRLDVDQFLGSELLDLPGGQFLGLEFIDSFLMKRTSLVLAMELLKRDGIALLNFHAYYAKLLTLNVLEVVCSYKTLVCWDQS